MNESRFSIEERAEIKSLMHEAMDEYFADKGKTGKHWLITMATIVASVTVILGGIKMMLTWLGFHYVVK